MFCRGRHAGFLFPFFALMLLFGVFGAVFGRGFAAGVGALFLLPLLALKFLFLALFVGFIARAASGRPRRHRPHGPIHTGQRPMTREEAEWEAFLEQARDEVDRIDGPSGTGDADATDR